MRLLTADAPSQTDRDSKSEQALEEAVKLGLDGTPEADIHPVVVSDGPTVALLRESLNAQLLVVGGRGRGGFTELALGSVSHQCVLHAACPVAIVRSDQITA